MKRTTRILSLVLTLAMMLSLCICGQAAADTAKYTPGTYNAAQTGLGGQVMVSMTFSEDAIVDVQVNGDNETKGIGSVAVEKLPGAILEAQSADVDVLTGATITSTAIIKGAKECIALAQGASEEVPEITLKPGTYTGSAIGYFKLNPVVVDVTVDENGITDIVIEDGNDETCGMVKSVKEHLLPRMIELNSVTVDAVTGATATSSAVKIAAAKALDAALADAGIDASATDVFDAQVPQSGETVTIDTDILVIGLGGSGTTALVSSAQNADGLKVVAIDKAGIAGGTSQMTCDVFAMNPVQFKNDHNNGEDYQDPQPMYDAWLAYTTGANGEQKAKVEMIDLLFAESGNTVDWLISDCGYVFNEPVGGFTAADNFVTKYQYSGGYSLPTRTETNGYFTGMIEKARKLGAEVYFETEAYALLTDENGAVTGALAHSMVDGTEYVINAKAVIDATGGFAGNDEMMKKYITSEYFWFDEPCGVVGSLQNDGKIMQAAIDLGAGVYNMNMPPEWHNAATPALLYNHEVIAAPEGDTHSMFLPQAYSLNDLPTILGSSANVLQVNMYGKRFNDETIKFRSAESGSMFYGIQSEASLKAIAENGLTSQRSSGFVNIGGWYLNQPIPELFDIVDEAIDLGICYKANTLDELAELTGMPADELKATVARYNELCEKGVDEDLGKPEQYLEAISEEGPYYAFAIKEYIYNTLGGLNVNEKLQVLTTEGNVIPGLYSVGNESIGVLFSNEKVYPTYGGMDMSWCYTTGRLSGINATDYVKALA